ncbi:hypothetical protein T310_4411 [Rasamsonia emersonii CBS 393.64]|uniref:Uncharacterized protein n=1 Tax=Rasamsonia emersonii (strain ATCC 16479 / CBS 393.64 / IMI 116815) TaxID=1408163 RepID=A0A0F4YTU4_RASE3|nr:hypothetical protein T310_4411 [Rasamsonia emersonii CBS 393.64]KKA21540.1 hypothetical protein T310_4411 [Rasamsonia emersonii CBS 393.64]
MRTTASSICYHQLKLSQSIDFSKQQIPSNILVRSTNDVYATAPAVSTMSHADGSKNGKIPFQHNRNSEPEYIGDIKGCQCDGDDEDKTIYRLQILALARLKMVVKIS